MGALFKVFISSVILCWGSASSAESSAPDTPAVEQKVENNSKKTVENKSVKKKVAKKSPSSRVYKCSSVHLKDKSCLFEKEEIRLRVSDARFSLFDGVWRNLQEFPYPGEGIEWIEIKLTPLKHRTFLEIKLWDKPVGLANIQSLVWMGYEIKGLKLEKKWQETLQKRRMVVVEQPAVERPKGTLPEPKKDKFQYDKKARDRVTLNKDGLLVISVGNHEIVER